MKNAVKYLALSGGKSLDKKKTQLMVLAIVLIAAFISPMAAAAPNSTPSAEVRVEGDFPEGKWCSVIVHFRQEATLEKAEILDRLPNFKLRYAVDGEPYIFNIGNFHAISGEVYVPSGIETLVTSYSHMVSAIFEEHEFHVLLDTSVDYIRAKQVWNYGYKGAGEVIAIIDTGIDDGHMDLDEGKVIAWKDWINNRAEPYDDHGHGTHCASIAAGTGEASGGTYTGVAPEASLIGLKVLNSAGSGSESDIIAAVQWCVDNKDKYGIDVISMSLGASRDCDGSCSMCQAVDNAWDEGLFVAVAAGNDGPSRNTIGCPGNAWKVMTVGAIDDSTGSIASFSSRGPTKDTRLDPDICAPGVSITAAKAGTTDDYTTMSGTSMATPHIAGVAALLIDAKGGSVSPNLVRGAMISTATDKGDAGPDIVYGWGIVNVEAAYNWIIDPPSVDVKAAKICYEASVSTGGETDVSVQLWSVGTSSATNVYIDDTLPSGFTLVSGQLDRSVGTMASGAIFKNTYRIKAPDTTGTYSLGKAYVTWDGGSTYTNDVTLEVTGGGGTCLGTILLVLVPSVVFLTVKIKHIRKRRRRK